MTAPIVPVGFDYAAALLRIRGERTYAQIAEYCGYDSPQAIGKVINGAIPAHPQGEAIWALYRELFDEKPPHNYAQASGMYESNSSSRSESSLGI